MKQHWYLLPLLPLLLTASIGCYSPDLGGGGHFVCPNDGTCPDGFTCSATGLCVKPGDETSACTAGSPTRIGTDLTTSIGLALDPTARRLHISFGVLTGEQIRIASRDVPTGEWKAESFSGRADAGQLGFTAVDALEDRVAVLFDGALDATSADAGFVARSVRVATAPGQPTPPLEVPYGAGSGAYLAVRHIPNQPAMVVAYRSDNRTQVALVSHESRQVIAGPVTLQMPPGAQPQGGQFNRIVITRVSSEEIEARVALLATGEAAGVESTQAYLARVTIPPSTPPRLLAPEPAERLGRLSIAVPAKSRGLDLALGDGLHAAWSEKHRNQTQVRYLAPHAEPEFVEPGGALPTSAGAPALAAGESRVGLAYIDDAGVLWLTVRPSAGEPWLAALPIEDTRNTEARQVKLAFLQASGPTVVMALAYANGDREVRYRTVTCTLPN